MAERLTVNQEVEGSIPFEIARSLEGTGSLGLLANLPDCLSGETGSTPVWAANGVFSLFGKTPGCESEEQGSIPENTQNWEDNGGCLPALDAGGRRFEPCFPDKCRTGGIGRRGWLRISILRVRVYLPVQK